MLKNYYLLTNEVKCNQNLLFKNADFLLKLKIKTFSCPFVALILYCILKSYKSIFKNNLVVAEDLSVRKIFISLSLFNRLFFTVKHTFTTSSVFFKEYKFLKCNQYLIILEKYKSMSKTMHCYYVFIGVYLYMHIYT